MYSAAGALQLAKELVGFLKSGIRNTHERVEWTQRNLRLLTEFAQAMEAESFPSPPGTPLHLRRSQFLWDFIAYRPKMGILLAAESEHQNDLGSILDDFEKLFYVRSPVKLMMCRVRSEEEAIAVRDRAQAHMEHTCIWYSAILVLVGIVVASRRKHLGLLPLALFAAYVSLYAFHLRSYYEMQSGTTDSRAALRFSMSLMSMWSILAGFGAASVFGWFRRRIADNNHNTVLKWLGGVFVILIAGVSYFTTLYFREDVVEDEFRVRVEPSAAAVQTASYIGADKTYIITLEPLILQMYAEPTVNLIDLHELNDSVVREIELDKGTSDLLYLDEQIYRNPVDAERYMSQLTRLNHFKRSTLANESSYSILKLSRGTADELIPVPSNQR